MQYTTLLLKIVQGHDRVEDRHSLKSSLDEDQSQGGLFFCKNKSLDVGVAVTMPGVQS